jgi:MFS family permease
MPLRIFRSRNLVGGNLIEVLAAAGMFSQFFLGALFLQHVRHYDALQIGLAFMPVAVVMGVLSVRYAERLAVRFGARRICVPGLLLIAAGLGLFALAPVNAGYLTRILPVMILLGAGGGVCFPAIMGLAMSGATAEDAGLASGLLNTTAQVGGALGLALLATVSAGRTQHLRSAGHTSAAALTGGYHLAFWVAAGLVALAAVVVVTVVRPAPVEEPAKEASTESVETAVAAL